MMWSVPSTQVATWLAMHSGSFTTTVTQAEILNGIEMLPAGRRRRGLTLAADGLFEQDFAGRILSFDSEAAVVFPIMVAMRRGMGRPISDLDAQIAAIVRAHGASLATRNTADFEHCGLTLVDLWFAT